jgi:hypothetical protein
MLAREIAFAGPAMYAGAFGAKFIALGLVALSGPALIVGGVAMLAAAAAIYGGHHCP